MSVSEVGRLEPGRGLGDSGSCMTASSCETGCRGPVAVCPGSKPGISLAGEGV